MYFSAEITPRPPGTSKMFFIVLFMVGFCVRSVSIPSSCSIGRLDQHVRTCVCENEMRRSRDTEPRSRGKKSNKISDTVHIAHFAKFPDQYLFSRRFVYFLLCRHLSVQIRLLLLLFSRIDKDPSFFFRLFEFASMEEGGCSSVPPHATLEKKGSRIDDDATEKCC